MPGSWFDYWIQVPILVVCLLIGAFDALEAFTFERFRRINTICAVMLFAIAIYAALKLLRAL